MILPNSRFRPRRFLSFGHAPSVWPVWLGARTSPHPHGRSRPSSRGRSSSVRRTDRPRQSQIRFADRLAGSFCTSCSARSVRYRSKGRSQVKMGEPTALSYLGVSVCPLLYNKLASGKQTISTFRSSKMFTLRDALRSFREVFPPAVAGMLLFDILALFG